MKSKIVTTTSLFLFAMTSLSLAACEKKKSKDSSEPEKTSQDSTTKVLAEETKPTAKPPAAEIPGKLKAIMVNLGSDMATLQAGLWLEDYKMIADSAMRVANHPKVSDSEKARVKKTMGDDFGAFVAMDKAVHGGALKVAEHANAKEMPKLLNELASLERGCVTCHSLFRSRLTQ